MPDKKNQDRQRFENPEPHRSDGYRATGGAWEWWWVWFIFLVCAFIWFAGWGWGSHGGWWWGNRPPVAQRNAGGVNGSGYNGPVGTPVGPADGVSSRAANGSTTGATAEAGANAAVLTSSNKREFEGQPFEATGVPVVKKVRSQVFWVGSDDSAPLLVVVRAPGNEASPADLKPGQAIKLSGTVEKAPPAAEAVKNWGLDPTEAAQLEQEGAYLSATEANPAQP